MAEMKPDLILMTGDFLFDDLRLLKRSARFGRLGKIAPTYTLLGNHDYGIVFPDESFLYTDSHHEMQNFYRTRIRLVNGQEKVIIKAKKSSWLALMNIGVK